MKGTTFVRRPTFNRKNESLVGEKILSWARQWQNTSIKNTHSMKTDIQIARETPLKRIQEIASNIGLPAESVEPYGHYMAKIPARLVDPEKVKQSRLILVTAITPTKSGIGKTTMSIGLALGLNRLGKRAIVALREPSLGPVFGMKGGAAGGGYAQVLPMENINLHFTGDFHAITSAHNTITALLDNYIYRTQGTPGALKQVLWKRVLDVNDRSLRYIVTGLHGQANGIPAESGFDITPASELMAILCLAEGEADLQRRIENILLGYTVEGKPFTVADLGIGGAITILLKDAINPNLVQTTEHTPAFVHGGPFANIAHGCNSVLATKMALTHADFAITEAGFGADLGAEKFYNIKCRKSGLRPALTVLVATAQSLKMHGGADEKRIKEPNMDALREGLKNLQRHLDNLARFGQTVVVAFNQFPTDTAEELDAVRRYCNEQGVRFALVTAFANGGAGAEELAREVLQAIEQQPSKPLQFTYADEDSIEEKIRKIATTLYGAADINLSEAARKKLKLIAGTACEQFPVCIAKTQYSFSDDAKRYGVASGFTLKIADIVINQGAEFLVAIAGDIMRMPGLPPTPAAMGMSIKDGVIEGLS